MSKSPNVIPIPSARRVDHALDSVAAADLRLSPDDLAALDAAEFSRA
jgi:aryl-alcohol dehydrogenase-like predicted oxidoreductase